MFTLIKVLTVDDFGLAIFKIFGKTVVALMLKLNQFHAHTNLITQRGQFV